MSNIMRSRSPNDSLVSESLVNSTFRLSVSLQRYFKDVRSRCYVLVNRNRPVRWLEKRIQNIFALPGKFCLSANGHMLPSCEPLALLSSVDTVDVVPLSDMSPDVEINGSTIEYLYGHNEENSSSSSILQSNSKQYKGKDLSNITKNCFGISENELSENDQNTSQSINEDQIDGTPHPDSKRPAYLTKPLVIDEQKISDDTTKSLLNMKHKALALLDSKLSAEEDNKKLEDNLCDPPRRTRHRVRRRRRRPDGEPPIEQQQVHTGNRTSCETELLQVSQTVQATMPQVLETAAVSLVSEPEHNISSSPIPEVTRNDTMYPRKPRVVYSLDE